jgi:hypothetical protein
MNVTRGFAPDDEVSDDMLAAAARRAVLRRLEREGGDAASIINNVYGSQAAGGGAPAPGLFEALSGEAGGGQGGEDPFDYFVDIERRDLEEPSGLDDEGRPVMKKIGWTKNVHRHRNHRDIDGGDSASIGLDPKKKVIR